MSKICSSCSVTLDDDAQFCPVCGATTEIAYCPNCRGVVERTAKFCKYCAFQIQASSETEQTTENPASLISPSGAAFAVICFFLPWTQVSCGEKVILQTGADIGGAYWFIPFLAITAFTAYFICKYRKNLHAARPFVIGSAVIAFCFLAHLYYTLHDSKEAQIKYGYFGSILGFLLAIAGCFFINRKRAKN